MMKKLIIALLAAISSSVNLQAQQPSVGCMDRGIRIQAEQTKQEFLKQGMHVYKDAMIGMQSNEPFPIGVQLTKGELYQIVFVGSMASSKMIMELFDENDKKIDERVQNRPIENNVIIYSFVPEKSDIYLLVFTQRLKNKSMCGSVTIMQKGEIPVATPAKTKK